MKNLNLILIALLMTGCGKASLSIGNTTIKVDTSGMNPLGSQSAFGEVSSCPSGMNLIPNAIGTSAFCMDPLVKASDYHSNAVTACGAQGRSVCSVSQLMTACGQGKIGSALYWTSNIAAYSGAYVINGGTCGNWGVSGSISSQSAYYCCSN